MHQTFPLPELARALLPLAFDRRDGAHDEGHLLRVWRNVERIVVGEGGDIPTLLAATLLHDCVWVDKASPERAMASRMAAARARKVLGDLGWEELKVNAVCHAIEAHSFSAGIEPFTLEARILQDADRLDAIGYAGIARCFYLAGTWGSELCDPADPTATGRALDDRRYALDHFQTKLLRLHLGFRTPTGRALAQARAERLDAFYRGFLEEIS
jgi:uncharacterized protein